MSRVFHWLQNCKGYNWVDFTNFELKYASLRKCDNSDKISGAKCDIAYNILGVKLWLFENYRGQNPFSQIKRIPLKLS